MNHKMIVPILFCAALVLIAGCTTTPTPAPTTAPEAVVANACYDSKGHVTFEIVNTGTAEAVIDYAWTLIDPATGEPIDAGEGSVTLGPDEFEGVSAPINTTIPHDDAGNSIICVNLSVDGKTIHQYRQ